MAIDLTPDAAMRPNPLESLKNVLDESERVKVQLQQMSKLLDELRAENGALKEQLKPLQVFTPLLEDDREYFTVTIKDPMVWKAVMAKCLLLYGKDKSYLFHTLVVEACLKQALFSEWSQVKKKFLGK